MGRRCNEVVREGGETEPAEGLAALREGLRELLLPETKACDDVCKIHSRFSFSSSHLRSNPITLINGV